VGWEFKIKGGPIEERASSPTGREANAGLPKGHWSPTHMGVGTLILDKEGRGLFFIHKRKFYEDIRVVSANTRGGGGKGCQSVDEEGENCFLDIRSQRRPRFPL